MVFDRSKEPKFGTKVKIIENAPFVDATETQQNGFQPAGSEVTVFEAKEINGKVYYRIGGQNQWIEKATTDWQIQPEPQTNYDLPKLAPAQDQPKSSRFASTDLSEDILAAAKKEQDQATQVTQPKKDIEKYDLAVKKGLALQKDSAVPNAKEIRKIFKEGQKFPENTKFTWIYEPDTAQNKYTNAKVKVTFPDGSSKEHSIHYNILAPKKKPQIQRINPVTPTQPIVQQTIPQNTTVKFVNPQPRDLNFAFIRSSSLLLPFVRNMEEALRLYQQAYYKQMSNTIRQGLELMTEQLLQLNQIKLDAEWNRANLSNQLGYIAFLKVLPKRIMDLCFSIKNYGNIGSHHNEAAQFNQASALTDLQQYHDLLVYLNNTYQTSGPKVAYADVQITDEESKHPNWYRRPRINQPYLTFEQYLERKNRPVQQTQATIYQQPTRPIIQPTQVTPQMTEPPKEKMGTGMKTVLAIFTLIGLIILGGIGYEVYHIYHKPAQTTAVKQSTSGSLKEQAANLNTDQQVALSVIYANLKLSTDWKEAYGNLTDNDYEVERYSQYKFGDAEVSAQGNNYIYVLEKDVGFGFKDENNHRNVSFFTSDGSSSASMYQMYKAVKNAGYIDQVNQLAKKLKYKNVE